MHVGEALAGDGRGPWRQRLGGAARKDTVQRVAARLFVFVQFEFPWVLGPHRRALPDEGPRGGRRRSGWW